MPIKYVWIKIRLSYTGLGSNGFLCKARNISGGGCSAENQLLFFSQIHLGLQHLTPGPPTRETRSVVWESWILLSQEELPENSEVLCLCNFQSQLLDFTGGWTRATDTPLSSALYLRILAIHLWKTSDPALSSYFPTQNIWPRDGKWLAQDHTAVWRQSPSGSFSLSHLPLCHVPWV